MTSDPDGVDAFFKRTIYSSFDVPTLEGIDDALLEQAILDYVLEKYHADDRAEVLDTIAPGFRAIYMTMIVEGEVNNGGFNQYFWNSEGRLTRYALEGFIRIGAPEYADLLTRATTAWRREQPGLKHFKEDGSMEAFMASYQETSLGAFDDDFYALAAVSDLSALRIGYIRSHLHEFVTPVEGSDD
jgi:hypothetical protein